MAFAPFTPFVGYEPVPAGTLPPQAGPAYFFQHQNGSKYLGYGPSADQLRAQIDRSKPPDQRTAMNDTQAIQQAMQDIQSAPPQAAPQVNPGGSLTMQIAPQQQENPLAKYASNVDPHDQIKALQGSAADRMPVVDMSALSAGQQQQLQQAQEHPVALPAGASESPGGHAVNEPPGKVVAPSGPLPMMRGASAAGGVSPQAPDPALERQLKYTAPVNPGRMAANAVAVPTAQSVVTEGGIQDPEARKAAVDAFHDQVEAQKNLAKVQEDAASAQLEQQRADLLEAQQRQGQAEQEIAHQQARQTILRQEYDKRMAIAQQDYDTSSKKEVDQYRIFKGSAGAEMNGILSAIASGLGAFGASLTHGPNYALQIVNNRIDRDVEAQRDEIHRGVAKSSNDLQRIATQYNMDYDDAAQILKMNYARSAEAALAKKAALSGTLQAKQAFAQVQPQFQAWQADAAAKLQANLDGKVKTVQEARMVQPSAGGPRMETDAEYNQRLKREAENAANAYKIGHQGAGPPKAAPEKTPGEVTPQLSRALVATETALRSVDELIAKNEARGYAGAAVNKLAGHVTDTEWNTLTNHGAQPIASAEANGMAADPRRTEELEKALNSGNYNTVKNHLNSLRDQLSKKRESILGVSAKTARVGQVGGADVGEGGGAEQ